MDPVSALSVASATVGLVDNGAKLLKKSANMFIDTREAGNFDDLERILEEITKEMEAKALKGPLLGSDDPEDIETFRECAKVASEATEALRKVIESTSSRQKHSLRGKIFSPGRNAKADRRIMDLSLNLTRVMTSTSMILLDRQLAAIHDQHDQASRLIRQQRIIKELESASFGRQIGYNSRPMSPRLFYDSDLPLNRPASLAATIKHEVLSWLRAPNDSEERHKGYKAMRLRAPETCTWLRDTPQYKQWRAHSRPSCLWVQGKAGSGKSMLMSKLVEDLSDSDHEEFFAYFYLGHCKVQTAWEVAVVLLKQLCKKSTIMPKTLQDLQVSYGPGRQPLLDSLLKAFEEVENSTSSDITILLDAWDIANMRHAEEFGKLFSRIISLPWKIFITSRGACPSGIEAVYWSQINMSTWSSADFEAFVIDRLDKEISVSELSFFDEKDALKNLVVQKIVEKSDQSFFLAEIQIQRILEQVNIRDIRLTLKELSESPEEIIHQALDLVMSQQERLRKLACTSLVWVANTDRPLSIEALGEGFAVLPSSRALYSHTGILKGTPSRGREHVESVKSTSHQRSSSLGHRAVYDKDQVGGETLKVKPDVPQTMESDRIVAEPRRDILDSPKAFAAAFLKGKKVFELDQEAIPPKKAFLGQFGCCKGLLIQEPGSLNVLLAYDDIKKHLRTYQRYDFTEKLYNQEFKSLSLACLYYLLQSKFESGPCDTQDMYYSRLDSNPFLDYAAICWPGHARKAEDPDVEILVSLLFKCRENLAAAVQVYLVNRLPSGSEEEFKDAYESSRSMTPLQIATRLNLMTIVKNLIKDCDPLEEDNSRNTALHEAMDHGNFDAFKLLFDKAVMGAFHKQSGELKPRQFFANVRDRDTLLRFYKTNVLDGKGIFDAIKGSNFPGLLACLCSGENVEESWVEAAMSSQSTDIISALIRFGAYRGDLGSGPMLHAIRTNRTEVVKILLDNFKSTPPNDVFFEAIIAGNSEAVKLLLEYGADIVAKAPDTRRGVLHEAVRRRLPDLVAYLLSQGADSCDTDNSGRTPLFDAIEVGDTSSIRQLLQYGVDIEAVDTRTGRQALHEAAINGNEEILLMIVNQLLKLDCRDNAGKTPLDYARENRHTKIFGILLARTKDVPEYAVSIQDSPIPTYDFPDKSLARRLTKTWSPDSQPRLEASAT